MRSAIIRRILPMLLLVCLLDASVAEGQTECSDPYRVKQQFPTTGPLETSWLICWRPVAGSGLVISAAYFRTSPEKPYVKVLDDARVAEIFVPYHSGEPRFLEVGYGWWLQSLTEDHCPSAEGGEVLDRFVCKEVRGRGLAWLNGRDVRRGEELILWSALTARNYRYVVEWTFRDDGVILGRLSATGPNLPSDPYQAHTHGAIWRLDFDLGGSSDDLAYLVRHSESGLTATDTSTPISEESAYQWNPEEFTTLRVEDGTLKNGNGKPSAYRLMPLRWGTPRHDEAFTKNDFWVTKHHPEDFSAVELPSLISPPESLDDSDIVLWYYGGLHHLPRDEDGMEDRGYWSGKTLLMWTGFMAMPQNLFDRTPLCSATGCE